MQLYRILLVTSAVFGIALAHPARAIEQYLNDTADSAVRVEVVLPGETEPKTAWEKLREYLGIRKISHQKPAIGTTFTVQSSAYASSPYQTDATPCITAAGTRVRPGVVASNFLPLGTVLEINGEEYIVEDRMNPRYNGYFIDIWFPSTSSALEFGRKNLTVVVKGYGKPGDVIREKEVVAQAEEDAAAEEDDPTVWSRLTRTISDLRGYLGAKVSPSVNRYDVDCFSEGA